MLEPLFKDCTVLRGGTDCLFQHWTEELKAQCLVLLQTISGPILWGDLRRASLVYTSADFVQGERWTFKQEKWEQGHFHPEQHRTRTSYLGCTGEFFLTRVWSEEAMCSLRNGQTKQMHHNSSLNFAAQTSVGGNARENWTLLRLLPFVVGSKVPGGDPAWDWPLGLGDIVDLLVKSTQRNYFLLRFNILLLLLLLLLLWLLDRKKHLNTETGSPTSFTQKTFRATLSRTDQGPLESLWTRCFEEKHSFLKCVRHTPIFCNIQLSLSVKHQVMVVYNQRDSSVVRPLPQATLLSTVCVLCGYFFDVIMIKTGTHSLATVFSPFSPLHQSEHNNVSQGENLIWNECNMPCLFSLAISLQAQSFVKFVLRWPPLCGYVYFWTGERQIKREQGLGQKCFALLHSSGRIQLDAVPIQHSSLNHFTDTKSYRNASNVFLLQIAWCQNWHLSKWSELLKKWLDQLKYLCSRWHLSSSHLLET